MDGLLAAQAITSFFAVGRFPPEARASAFWLADPPP
jgi:hypothetical protein